MKSDGKLQARIFVFIGIMLMISALASIITRTNFLPVSFIPLGFCFIAIGFGKNKKQDK